MLMGGDYDSPFSLKSVVLQSKNLQRIAKETGFGYHREGRGWFIGKNDAACAADAAPARIPVSTAVRRGGAQFVGPFFLDYRSSSMILDGWARHF
jgi:hypothetical protein